MGRIDNGIDEKESLSKKITDLEVHRNSTDVADDSSANFLLSDDNERFVGGILECSPAPIFQIPGWAKDTLAQFKDVIFVAGRVITNQPVGSLGNSPTKTLTTLDIVLPTGFSHRSRRSAIMRSPYLGRNVSNGLGTTA